MKTMDWSKLPSLPGPQSSGGETQWVIPEKFFDEFGEVLDMVPPQPGEEALYGQFHSVLDAARQYPEIRKSLVETAKETEQQVITPFFLWKHNGRPAGNGWNRSVHNAEWGLDYFNRTGTMKGRLASDAVSERQ